MRFKIYIRKTISSPIPYTTVLKSCKNMHIYIYILYPLHVSSVLFWYLITCPKLYKPLSSELEHGEGVQLIAEQIHLLVRESHGLLAAVSKHIVKWSKCFIYSADILNDILGINIRICIAQRVTVVVKHQACCIILETAILYNIILHDATLNYITQHYTTLYYNTLHSYA